jgi:hypothetical protein
MLEFRNVDFCGGRKNQRKTLEARENQQPTLLTYDPQSRNQINK